MFRNTTLYKVADVVLCQSISADGSTRKRLVIMDEVDGMGGSDRGGIPELIKVSDVSFNSPLSLPLSITHTNTRSFISFLFISFSLSLSFSIQTSMDA